MSGKFKKLIGSQFVFEYLKDDAFKIHGQMFNVKDAIQSLIYICPEIYDMLYSPQEDLNSLFITVFPKDEIVSATFGRCRKRSNEIIDINTVIVSNNEFHDDMPERIDLEEFDDFSDEDEDIDTSALSFILGTGFIKDNFKIIKPKESNREKFLSETNELILTSADIEKLVFKK